MGFGAGSACSCRERSASLACGLALPASAPPAPGRGAADRIDQTRDHPERFHDRDLVVLRPARELIGFLRGDLAGLLRLRRRGSGARHRSPGPAARKAWGGWSRNFCNPHTARRLSVPASPLSRIADTVADTD